MRRAAGQLSGHACIFTGFVQSYSLNHVLQERASAAQSSAATPQVPGQSRRYVSSPQYRIVSNSHTEYKTWHKFVW
jgi:hypothetical protein